MKFSLPELLSDLSADALTVSLDMPDGGYDRLHRFIERHGIVPRSRRDRLALVAVIIIASRLMKQRLGPMGPVSNFFSELTEDAVREEAKRILAGMSREDIRTMDRVATGLFPWLTENKNRRRPWRSSSAA